MSSKAKIAKPQTQPQPVDEQEPIVIPEVDSDESTPDDGEESEGEEGEETGGIATEEQYQKHPNALRFNPLRRCQFVDGAEGTKLFLNYLLWRVNERHTKMVERADAWREKELERIEELTGVADPKAKLARQIERLQKKLLVLQNNATAK